MCWLLVIVAVFFSLGVAGGWEAGVGILFMLTYPMVLYFLSKVGVIGYNPILIPISLVFWTGALYQLLKEERETKAMFKKLIRTLKEVQDEKKV